MIYFILFPLYLFADSKTLIFSPLPMKDTKTIHFQFLPMIRYLEKKLKIEIKIDHNNTYDEIIKKFTLGKIDLAYLGPLPYLSLEKEYSYALPLVNFKNKKGESSYTCSLVSFISNYDSIEDIKNTKIALTQPLSTCGYLFVYDILKSFVTNIEENKYKYLERHDNVALSIIRDEFKFGGLKTDIAKEYYHLGLKELKRSKPMPNFVLVANSKTLNKNLILDIKKSLISVDKNELSSWDETIKYGVKETNIKDYTYLRNLINSTKIPHESKF